jgi:hypothetical protein
MTIHQVKMKEMIMMLCFKNYLVHIVVFKYILVIDENLNKSSKLNHPNINHDNKNTSKTINKFNSSTLDKLESLNIFKT